MNRSRWIIHYVTVLYLCWAFLLGPLDITIPQTQMFVTWWGRDWSALILCSAAVSALVSDRLPNVLFRVMGYMPQQLLLSVVALNILWGQPNPAYFLPSLLTAVFHNFAILEMHGVANLLRRQDNPDERLRL